MTTQQFEMYQEEATRFAEGYGCTNEHIHHIIASVMMQRDGVGFGGGSFVTAVIENNLEGAVSRADSECLEYLPVIVASFRYAHLQSITEKNI